VISAFKIKLNAEITEKEFAELRKVKLHYRSIKKNIRSNPFWVTSFYFYIMISISKAGAKDSGLLSHLAKISFIESHGKSASAEVINKYADETYNEDAIKKELSDHKNIYHIIYKNEQPAGFSKIIFSYPHSNVPVQNVTKMERLYLLKEFYGSGTGTGLFDFNIELSKQNSQAGMWLFVWKENPRAISFYKKAGFKIIGSHDFKLSETHSNPNHQMLLMY
jgi:ribosomal protein S18 acetylase RimI-like enzyme